ncbi:MAG TPA: hypothetical protein VIE65_18005 [Methylobacter sp.]
MTAKLHAYVLMTNHVHLLMPPFSETSLGKTLQMLGRYYVQYFDYCYRRLALSGKADTRQR